MQTSRTQSNSRPIKCSVCEATFTQWEQFFRHVNSAHPDTHVTCAWCGLFFMGNTLKRHMMHTHADSSKKPRPNARQHHMHSQTAAAAQKAKAEAQAQAAQAQAQYQALQLQGRRMMQSQPKPAATSKNSEIICQHCLVYSSHNVDDMKKHYKDAHDEEMSMALGGSASNLPIQSRPASTQRRLGGSSNHTASSTESAAAALVSMASQTTRTNRPPPPGNQRVRSGGQQEEKQMYIIQCTNCKTFNHLEQNASWIVCYDCKNKFSCDSARVLSASEARELARNSNRSSKSNSSRTSPATIDIKRIAPHVSVGLDQILTDDEIKELRTFETSLATKDEQYLRRFLMQMVNQAIRNRRSAEDLDDKLVGAQKNIAALEQRLGSKVAEVAKTKTERDGYKAMALRLHNQNVSLKSKLQSGTKRPLPNPEEDGPAAKKLKLNDSTAVPVKSENGATESPVKPDLEGEDVKMTDADERAPSTGAGEDEKDVPMTENGEVGETGDIDPAAKEAYDSAGKKLMAEQTRGAKSIITKLMSNPKANALQQPPLDIEGNPVEGHMDLQQLNRFVRKPHTIWEVESEMKKLWTTAEFLSSVGSMPPETVQALRMETQFQFWKITEDVEKWDYCSVGKFFESQSLPEIDTVVRNVINDHIDGAKLLTLETPESCEQMLGLSAENAAIMLKALEKSKTSMPATLEWNSE